MALSACCSVLTRLRLHTTGADTNTGVVLLGGAAEHHAVAAAPPGLLPERPSADVVDEEPTRFPWAEPDALAAASTAAASVAGQQGLAEGPEAPQDAVDDEEMEDAGGAAEQLRLPPELTRAPPGPVDPDLQARQPASSAALTGLRGFSQLIGGWWELCGQLICAA